MLADPAVRRRGGAAARRSAGGAIRRTRAPTPRAAAGTAAVLTPVQVPCPRSPGGRAGPAAAGGQDLVDPAPPDGRPGGSPAGIVTTPRDSPAAGLHRTPPQQGASRPPTSAEPRRGR